MLCLSQAWTLCTELPRCSPTHQPLEQGKAVHVTVSTSQMKAVLDSGAEMSVVAAHVVPPSAYTGDNLKAAGVWGEGSLPLAKLTIGAEKGSSTILVLVREGLQ